MMAAIVDLLKPEKFDLAQRAPALRWAIWTSNIRFFIYASKAKPGPGLGVAL